MRHSHFLCATAARLYRLCLKADFADDVVPGLANPTKVDPVLKRNLRQTWGKSSFVLITAAVAGCSM